ncbi:hypothetical protein ScPMuIL_015276 [Solemya velum]
MTPRKVTRRTKKGEDKLPSTPPALSTASGDTDTSVVVKRKKRTNREESTEFLQRLEEQIDDSIWSEFQAESLRLVSNFKARSKCVQPATVHPRQQERADYDTARRLQTLNYSSTPGGYLPRWQQQYKVYQPPPHAIFPPLPPTLYGKLSKRPSGSGGRSSSGFWRNFHSYQDISTGYLVGAELMKVTRRTKKGEDKLPSTPPALSTASGDTDTSVVVKRKKRTNREESTEFLQRLEEQIDDSIWSEFQAESLRLVSNFKARSKCVQPATVHPRQQERADYDTARRLQTLNYSSTPGGYLPRWQQQYKVYQPPPHAIFPPLPPTLVI